MQSDPCDFQIKEVGMLVEQENGLNNNCSQIAIIFRFTFVF